MILGKQVKHKRGRMHDFIYVKFKNRQVLLFVPEVKKCILEDLEILTCRGYEGISGLPEMFSLLISIMYMFIKIRNTVHLVFVHAKVLFG